MATRNGSDGTKAVQNTPNEHVQIAAKSANLRPILSDTAPRTNAPTAQPIRNDAPAYDPIVATSCLVAAPPDISAAMIGR